MWCREFLPLRFVAEDVAVLTRSFLRSVDAVVLLCLFVVTFNSSKSLLGWQSSTKLLRAGPCLQWKLYPAVLD